MGGPKKGLQMDRGDEGEKKDGQSETCEKEASRSYLVTIFGPHQSTKMQTIKRQGPDGQPFENRFSGISSTVMLLQRDP